MDGGNVDAPPPPLPRLTAEAAAQFQEGINLILSRWTALQLAVEKKSRGRHSDQKPQQLSIHLFSLLTQSKERVYIEDVEYVLHKFMESLETLIADGSVDEVASKLMEMHNECSQGNFDSIRRLKEANPPRGAAFSIRQVNSDDDEDEDEDEDDGSEVLGDDDSSPMVVDPPESQVNYNRQDRMVDEPTAKVSAQTEDGWTVVGSRRNKGRRN